MLRYIFVMIVLLFQPCLASPNDEEPILGFRIGSISPDKLALTIQLPVDWFFSNPLSDDDVGLAPTITWEGSTNVHHVYAEWPEPPYTTLHHHAYTGDVIVPLTIIPQNPWAPASLNLLLTYLLCNKTRLPQQANVTWKGDLPQTSLLLGMIRAGKQIAKIGTEVYNLTSKALTNPGDESNIANKLALNYLNDIENILNSYQLSGQTKLEKSHDLSLLMGPYNGLLPDKSYYLGGNEKLKVIIADGSTISYGILGNDDAIEGIIRATKALSVAQTGPNRDICTLQAILDLSLNSTKTLEIQIFEIKGEMQSMGSKPNKHNVTAYHVKKGCAKILSAD